MATADVQRLINNATVRLPGATLPVLQLELFNVMDDFFKGSNIWQEDIDVPVPGNDPAGTIYPLAAQSPAQIVRLMWVFQKPTTTSIRRGSAWLAAMSVPGELTISPQPSSAITLTATVALSVLDPTDRNGYVQFPTWVLDKYSDVILDGLLGKMMSQPAKPYTNLQMSVLHLRNFTGGISQARVEQTRNNKYRQQAWSFPGFTGGSQRSGRWPYVPPQ